MKWPWKNVNRAEMTGQNVLKITGIIIDFIIIFIDDVEIESVGIKIVINKYFEIYTCFCYIAIQDL